MVSPKQLTFYIVPSISYFALAMAMFIFPIVQEYLTKINSNNWRYKAFYYFNIAAILIVISIAILNFGSYSRDKELIQDIDKISKVIGIENTISLSKSLHGNWSLIAQFQRKYNINIDFDEKLNTYLLIPKDEDPIADYDVIISDLSLFTLYKKRN